MGEFRLKILLGGNVVLVECAGREAEMFVPVIMNNRITFQNVIERRRCCKQNSNNALKPVQYSTENVKLPSGMSIRQFPPLANSTPERRSRYSKENKSPMRRYPTPEIVRRAVVQSKNVSVSMPGFSPGLKIVRLHRVPTPNTPNKLAKIAPLSRTKSTSIAACRSQTQILRNLSNVSSFKTPSSPHVTSDTIGPGSPNQSFLVRRNGTLCSATKWRKCITPQRTYIRRKNCQKTTLKVKELSVKPLQYENGKVVPDFLLNSTTYPTGNGRVLIKRRKLIIDTSTTITPSAFKNQLKHTEDLKRTNLQFPKGRRQLISFQLTAFDLLTNSSYYPQITQKLNALFRQGCLNKHAETIMKYQQLIMGIPNLQTNR